MNTEPPNTNPADATPATAAPTAALSADAGPGLVSGATPPSVEAHSPGRSPRNSEADLAGKVALVTGSGRGIGAAVAKALAAHGATVVVTGRTKDELDAVVDDIGRIGAGRGHAVVGDLLAPGFVDELFEHVQWVHGRLDILVNNAGTASFGPIDDVSVDSVRSTFELNTIVPYACMRAGIRIMRRTSPAGVIVNIGSTEAHWTAQGESGAYPASKFALRALTYSVAKQMKAEKTGIRVSQIDPGGVDTALQDHLPPEAKPYLLDPQAVARSVLHVATAPADVHVLDTIVVAQPFSTW